MRFRAKFECEVTLRIAKGLRSLRADILETADQFDRNSLLQITREHAPVPNESHMRPLIRCAFRSRDIIRSKADDRPAG
jgi:hypothetical protein